MIDPTTEILSEQDHAPLVDVEDRAYPTNEWSLCLSGGGFRAMLFHTGALWRLHETGLLSRINFFSSVSGGSIANGWLAMNWNSLMRPGAAFNSTFVDGMRPMARTPIDCRAVLRGIISGPVSKYVAAAYDRVLFHQIKLQDLPNEPRFIFTASKSRRARRNAMAVRARSQLNPRNPPSRFFTPPRYWARRAPCN